MAARPTCIDLFCGCGGFTLGIKQAGFRTLAAIDFDPHAIEVFRANFPPPEVPHVLCEDLTRFTPADLAQLIRTDTVDLIIGGPPCQGFSHVRQRDGANHGPRLVADPRRALYKPFLDYVAHFRPAVFVMENVLGIRNADSGRYFTAVQHEARQLGYRVHPQIIRAAEFGCPQKRQRQLVIGTRTDLSGCFRPSFIRPTHPDSDVTLWEAIGDLSPVPAGGGKDPADYDLERRKSHIQRYGRRYTADVLEVNHVTRLTAHVARPHSDRDLRDFARLREGEHAAQAIARGEKMEFPYDRTSFHDRYTRQHRNRLCSTIVAHLSKDGLMFIHPTQNRSLTPREAARVQSFPDWFEFPLARTHQFRIIGNAVPPLVGKAVGCGVRAFLAKYHRKVRSVSHIPKNSGQAIAWLRELLSAEKYSRLKDVPADDFKRSWSAVFYVHPGLHPDNIPTKQEDTRSNRALPEWCPLDASFLTSPYYVQAGWPVALEPVLKEAWTRYRQGLLTDDEFYCIDAQRAGINQINR